MLKKIFFYPALFILCWLYAINFNDIDYDLWARMAVGKIFFQTGGILHNDIFSYTVTKEWIDHEWGSGVIFYFFSDKFGDIGLLLLKVTLFFSVLFLITRIIKLQNNQPEAHKNILFYLFIILAVYFGIGHTVRCQLFTFTLFTLWIYVLERVRRGEIRLLWIMPATMLIWANLHGGFVAGIGLLIMYAAGEFLNKKSYLKYLIILIPTSLVTLINPYGFKYLEYIFFATTLNRIGIGEWENTNLFGDLAHWYSLKIVIIITLLSIIFYFIKNRPTFSEIDKVKFIVLGVTFYLAISHIKHQAFFVISAASFVYHDFYAIFDTTGRFIKEKTGKFVSKTMYTLGLLKNGAVYAIILTSGILLMVFNPIQVVIPIDKFPIGSVEFVRQNNLKGNLLTVFHWGSYAAWKLYPNCLIALDGRFEEVYPLPTFYHVGAFMTYFNKPEYNFHWDNILRQYHTDIVILGTITDDNKQAFKAMKKKKEWKMVYGDLISAVFVRKKDFKENYVKPDLDPEKVFGEKYETKLNFFK